jgi:hypothetical protein
MTQQLSTANSFAMVWSCQELLSTQQPICRHRTHDVMLTPAHPIHAYAGSRCRRTWMQRLLSSRYLVVT